MTDEQRKRGHDINARAEPLFRELARVDDFIRHLQKRLHDALDKRKKIEAQINDLSDEKAAWYEEILASKED